MPKLKKVKSISPVKLLFILIAIFMCYLGYKTILAPLASIYLSGINSDVPTIDLSQEQYDKIIAERDLWDWKVFDHFKLRLPNYEKIEIDSPNLSMQAFQITDPDSGEKVSLSIKRTPTDRKTIENLLPEDAEQNILYGFTVLGEYDALRVGPLEPPYDSVGYFILKDGYIYEIDAVFSTPAVFLDQILSSFVIEETPEAN